MAGGHGGRRSRSGPRPDPTSERAEKRAATAAKAAAKKPAREPAKKRAPSRSSSAPTSPVAGTVLGRRFGLLPRAGYAGRPPDWPLKKSGDSEVHDREQQVWKEIWRTPQAAAWATEPWRWRSVAMFVRWSVRMEQGDASAATATAAIRLADQIGLTPNGMRDNEWEVEEVPGSRAASQTPAGAPSEDGAGGAPTARPAGATAMQQRLTIVKSTRGSS